MSESATYFPNDFLAMRSFDLQALVEQWIDFASMEIDSNSAKWIYPRLGMGIFNEEVWLWIIASLS